MATKTKGDLVNESLALLRISGVTREPTPEDMADGLLALEEMVLSWETKGLRIGYIKSAAGNIDPSDESGIRDNNERAVKYGLAVTLADYFGKQPSVNLVATAKTALEGLYDTIPPIRRQSQYQPAGAGNQYHCGDEFYQRFMPRDDRLNVEDGGQLGMLEAQTFSRFGFNHVSNASSGGTNGGTNGGTACDCTIDNIPGLQDALDSKADASSVGLGIFTVVLNPVVDTSASIISSYIQDINRDISGEVTSPQSIAYNEADDSLYVLQQGTNMIFQYNLDGTRGQRTIDATSAEFSNNRPLTSLAIHNGFFYALAGRNTNPATSFLRRWPVSDSSPPTSWTTPANQILSPIPFADSLFLVDNLVHQISGSEGYVYAFATIIDALTPFTPPTIPAGGLDRFTEGPNDTIYGVNLANGDVRIQAFTEDYEPAGPLFTVVGSPPPVVAGDQIVAAGTDIYSTNLNTEVLLRYNSQETTGITLAGTNIAFLAEINGGLNLPGGGTATVTTAIDDNTIAISTSATLTDGVLTGDVTRIHSVGDVTEVVKVDPLLIAPRPND